MKMTTTLLAVLLFVTLRTTAPAATMGFTGELEVHSVSSTDGKAVLVVSGPCELLLAKTEMSKGEAQVVQSVVDHTALVLYRRGSEFPTDQAWQAACEKFKLLVGQHAHSETALPHYAWWITDLTVISTDGWRILPGKSDQ